MFEKCICGSKAIHNSTVRKGCRVDDKGNEQPVNITTVECKKCGVVRQINLPFALEEKYIEYYKKEYPPIKQEYSIKNYEHDRGVASLRCDAYNLSKQVRILDVGSGSGAFVDECRSRGVEAYGCEIGEYHYQESGGKYIYKKQFEDVYFPTDHFSVVTCHDVLEHVLDPLKMLKELFRVTAQNGKCIIDFPRFYHEAGKHHWKGIEHIWYFTEEQLEELAASVGFNVEKIEHPIESKTVFYFTKPKQKRVKILLPPGIGDTYWVIVKIEAFIKREGIGIPDVYVMCNEEKKYKTDKRSFPFIEMFPFLNAADTSIGITTAKELWQEAYVKRGRTVFRNILGCDYFMSYNGVLESGVSLENVDPDLKCNWFPNRFISLEEEKYRTDTIQKYGKYIVFFFVFRGSFSSWGREFSADKIVEAVKKIIAETGCTPVFTGALWDKEDVTLNTVKTQIPNLVDLTGQTSVAQLFGLLRGSEMVIGFPCGLTMLAVALKQKVLMIWNDWNHYGFMWNSVPPGIKNKTYFIENTKNLTVDVLVQKAKDIFTGTATSEVYEDRLYNHTKEIATKLFKEYKIPVKSRILNINSGGGTFVDVCREKGIEAYGNELFKYDYEKNSDFIYRKEFEDIHFPTDHFDYIVCYATVGYKLNPILFFKEVFRTLQQNGVFILKYTKKTMHTNVWFYSVKEIKNILENIGFTPVNFIGDTLYFKKPKQKRIKILLPPGIGDAYWEIIKLQAFLRRGNLGVPDIYIACRKEKLFKAHERAFPFIEMFPFMHSTGIMKDVGDQAGRRNGLWSEAYRKEGRTVFSNVLECDYFICHNGHLTAGTSLEAIDPDLKCNWFPPMFVSLEQENYKKQSKKQ